MESLHYFGHGLSREQAEALQLSEQAFVLDFTHPKDLAWEGLRSANEVAAAVAQQTGGLLWDGETREVFTPAAWREIQGLLKNEPFDIPTLHAGQIVEVDQADVFDYIRRYPDGTEEGNETGAIIQRMQQ